MHLIIDKSKKYQQLENKKITNYFVLNNAALVAIDTASMKLPPYPITYDCKKKKVKNSGNIKL